MDRNDPGRVRDARPGRLETPPHVLVASPSFALRNSYSSALEDDGFVVHEAASTDEVLWTLVAGRTGEGTAVDLIVADVATPGAVDLLAEVHGSPTPPALVLVGRGEATRRQPGLDRVTAVDDPRDIEALRRAVEEALDGR